MKTVLPKVLMALLLVGKGLPIDALGSTQATTGGASEPTPVILVGPDDPLETPELTCEICARVTKPKANEDPTSAELTLTHEGSFVGDVELIVWLDTDERDSLWIPSVTIVDRDVVTVEVLAKEGWDWHDVRFAWTRLYTSQ